MGNIIGNCEFIVQNIQKIKSDPDVEKNHLQMKTRSLETVVYNLNQERNRQEYILKTIERILRLGPVDVGRQTNMDQIIETVQQIEERLEDIGTEGLVSDQNKLRYQIDGLPTTFHVNGKLIGSIIDQELQKHLTTIDQIITLVMENRDTLSRDYDDPKDLGEINSKIANDNELLFESLVLSEEIILWIPQ